MATTNNARASVLAGDDPDFYLNEDAIERLQQNVNVFAGTYATEQDSVVLRRPPPAAVQTRQPTAPTSQGFKIGGTAYNRRMIQNLRDALQRMEIENRELRKEVEALKTRLQEITPLGYVDEPLLNPSGPTFTVTREPKRMRIQEEEEREPAQPSDEPSDAPTAEQTVAVLESAMALQAAAPPASSDDVQYVSDSEEEEKPEAQEEPESSPPVAPPAGKEKRAVDGDYRARQVATLREKFPEASDKFKTPDTFIAAYALLRYCLGNDDLVAFSLAMMQGGKENLVDVWQSATTEKEKRSAMNRINTRALDIEFSERVFEPHWAEFLQILTPFERAKIDVGPNAMNVSRQKARWIIPRLFLFTGRDVSMRIF